MILDRLEMADRYAGLQPGFAEGLQFLRRISTDSMTEGRHMIDGDRLIALVARSPGRGRDGAQLEVHRRYIDLQYCVSGEEVIGWRPLADCSAAETQHDETRDIRFFADRPETWLALPPGMLAIFFPADAHAPLAGTGDIFKVVVKVAVDWK